MEFIPLRSLERNSLVAKVRVSKYTIDARIYSTVWDDLRGGGSPMLHVWYSNELERLAEKLVDHLGAGQGGMPGRLLAMPQIVPAAPAASAAGKCGSWPTKMANSRKRASNRRV